MDFVPLGDPVEMEDDGSTRVGWDSMRTATWIQRTAACDSAPLRGINDALMSCGPERDGEVRSLKWKQGSEAPPFVATNTEVVKLLRGLVDGTELSVDAVELTEAVAVQIYLLVFDADAGADMLSGVGFDGVYAILASLKFGVRALPPDGKAIKRLQAMLDRSVSRTSRQAPGLIQTFRERVKKRLRDDEMRGMDRREAQNHLILRWDHEAFAFDFGEGATGSGGEGGGGRSSSSSEKKYIQPADFKGLDRRTQAFAAWSVRKAATSLSTDITPWHRAGGSFSFDVLVIMDEIIWNKPMPHQAKRDLSFEMQLVEVRKEVDQLRAQERQLALAAQRAQREPARLVRQLDAERGARAAERRSFEAAADQTKREHGAQLKEAKAQACYNLRSYQRQMMDERKEQNDRVTRVESIVTDRDREILRLKAALRHAMKEGGIELAKLEAELEKALEGRTWARVNEEKALRGKAEAALKEAEAARQEAKAETKRAQQAANVRNNSTAYQKQQLEYYKKRTKELEEKVASYDVRKQRGFWEVEPVAEENDRLRVQLAKAEKVCARLDAIVNPAPSKFYSSREREDGSLIGGRRTSDDWDVLDMGLSVYNLPENNTKPVVEAVAQFFGIKVPTEEREVYCRKQGVRKKITRSLVPSATKSKENLKVGGEVSDLVTYTEIAEAQTLGLTFDGATINMYSVLGAGVCMVTKNGKRVRRMAFAEHMTRETVANKMRKLQEFFARGKACLQVMQHPLADQVDMDRSRACVSDRGGADGCVAKALEQRLVRSAQRKIGRERWEKVGIAAKDGETQAQTWGRIYSSWRTHGGAHILITVAGTEIRSSSSMEEAWEAAEYLFDHDELNLHAVDPEYEALKFTDLSHDHQELLVVQQLLGLEAYEQLSEKERIVFVAIFCLEHALSNTLVAIDGGMDEYAREIVTGFIADEKKKEKAFVEVNSSPGNKLTLAFCKLFAPCSDKDWARSFHFKGWELERYGTYSLSDLEAILGSRFGIFFKNAKPILCGWEHGKEFLDEQELLDDAGKLRTATLSALSNLGLRANFIAKAIFAEYIYWPWMLKMNHEVEHPFDMAPPLQEASKSLEAAIEKPSLLLTGRARLFGDHMPVPTLSPETEKMIAEVEMNDELRKHVTEFLRRGLIRGLPQLVKHTAEYQEGGIAAKNDPAARAAAAALPASAHGQEGDFGHIQGLCGSKGKARHQKLRSAAAHAKLKRNQTLDALRDMQPAARRRYLALGRLMRVRRVRREGRTRADIARKHAEGNKQHRQGQLNDKKRKLEEAAKERTELEGITRITTMCELHHLNMPELKQQLRLRKVLDKMKLDNKALTLGGKRPEILPRLKSVLLQENTAAADNYDIAAPKTAYLDPSAAATVAAATDPEDEPAEAMPNSIHDEEASPVERIEAQELRNHEVHYLIKWRGKDESCNSWVSEVDLPDAFSIELAAAFEEEEEEEELEEEEREVEGEVGEEGDEAEQEFVVEVLLDRNYNRSLRIYEYLVRWGVSDLRRIHGSRQMRCLLI